MNILFQQITRKVRFCTNKFDDFCKPNPDYLEDKVQMEIFHQRNRVFAIFESIVAVVFVLNLLTGNGSFIFNMQGLIATVGTIATLFTFGRHHPEVFRIVYNMINITYTLLLTLHDDQEVHGGWAASQVFPGIVYLFTGSIWHFVFNMIVQITFVNTIFQEPIKRTIMDMTPDAFMESLTYHLHQTIIYSVIFTVLTHSMLQNAYHQASVADKKKEDFERQKNFLLGFFS